MKEGKGFRLIKKTNGGDAFVHLRAIQASTYKTLQEIWGVRFDIESDSKNLSAVNVRSL